MAIGVYNTVRDRFGMPKTVEITALVGHYVLVGQILAAFEVDLPEGAKPEIPEQRAWQDSLPLDGGRGHVKLCPLRRRRRARARVGVKAKQRSASGAAPVYHIDTTSTETTLIAR